MMSKLYSIIISRSENEHANDVENQVRNSGLSVLRFNVDTINSNIPLVALHTEKEEKYINFNGLIVPEKNIISVFTHIPRIEVSKNIGLDDLDRKIISSAWSNFISSLEYFLPNALWVNKISAAQTSNNIYKQFAIAQNLNLKTPSVLFTNDSKLVEDFYKVNKPIVFKTGSLLGVHFDKQRILVDKVKPKDIIQEELVLSPTFFQKYIDKKYELRIHVIGNKVLVCRIDSQKSKKTKIDWRNYDIANTPHYKDKISKEIENKLIELVRRLNLNFGIIDGIIDKDGEFNFLECNAYGHWLWIESLTGLPITKYLVNLLLGNKKLSC